MTGKGGFHSIPSVDQLLQAMQTAGNLQGSSLSKSPDLSDHFRRAEYPVGMQVLSTWSPLSLVTL